MSQRSARAQVIGLIGWLVVAFVAGGLGAVATMDAPTFYAQLIRPTWAPPASIFGPVWSTLYALMATAAWLVWRSPHERRAAALALFIAQLLINATWSWLFFAWRLGALAFFDVLVLLALIAACIVYFWRISRLSAALLAPYFAWTAFACALTWAVWRRNPALLG